MIKCSYGCEQTAIGIFKNGKFCCNENPANCPAIKPPKIHPICKYCGKEIIGAKRGKIRCNECKMAGKGKKRKATDQQKKISSEKRKATNIKKYGVEFPIQLQKYKIKRKNNNFEKYGCEPIQTKEVKDKRNKTIKDKYGVDNISQSDLIKEKKRLTLQKNYGVDSPLQCDEIKQRAINTNMERYGVRYYTESVEFKRRVRKYHEYESTYSSLIEVTWCRFCGRTATVYKGYSKYAICDDCYDNDLHVTMDEDILKTRNIISKITNNNKYGTDFPWQSEEVKDKIKKTNLERYGVENVFSNNNIKNKIKKTNLEKYGAENPGSKDSSVRIAIRNNYIRLKLNKYMDEFEIDIIGDYTGMNDIHHFKCRKCGNEFELMFFRVFQRIYACSKCATYKSSKAELEIVSFIENDLKISNIIKNSRAIIKPKELDIYLPDYNIAIEYHGLYWHSTASNENFDKNYHRNKYESCKEKGIRLIQIFEDEWILNEELVKSKLTYIFKKAELDKIYARKCHIKEIDASIKNKFLDNYHIQGKDNATVKLGAFYNNELISVMTFAYGNISKGSKNEKDVWELNRFASHNKYIIIGIAGKLLKYFENNYKWKEIFSYADLRWSEGNLYDQLGFELSHITKPNYFYIKGMERIHRFNLRKRSDEPKDIPEWLLRLEEGYHRIWDAGHLKFTKNKPFFQQHRYENYK